MKFLFIETEGLVEVEETKLVEFDYLLTDEDFKIIDSNKLIVKPSECKRTYYDFVDVYDEFDEINNNMEEFPFYYKKIKSLLEDKDTKVFGYIANSDIKILDDTCKEYGLERFNYDLYDVVNFVQYHNPLNKNELGLNSIYKSYSDLNEFKVETKINETYKIMLVLKSILNKMDTDLDSLLYMIHDKKTNSLDYCNFIDNDNNINYLHGVKSELKDTVNKLLERNIKYIKNEESIENIHSVSIGYDSNNRIIFEIIVGHLDDYIHRLVTYTFAYDNDDKDYSNPIVTKEINNIDLNLC